MYAPPTQESSLSSAALLEHIRASSLKHTDKISTAGAGRPAVGPADKGTLDAYFSLRHKDRAAVLRLSARAFRHLAEGASALHSVPALEHIATDAVEAFAHDALPRARRLRHLIALAARLPDFPRLRVLSLLRTLQLTGQPMSLAPDTVAALARDVFWRPAPEMRVDRALLRLLQPLVLEHLRAASASAAAAAEETLVAETYFTVWRLTQCDLQPQALELYEALTAGGHLPREATRDRLIASADFGTVVLASLVRACLHRNWPARALALLESRVAPRVGSAAAPPLEPPLHDFVLDVLHPILRGGRKGDVRGAARVLVALVRRPPASGSGPAAPFVPARLFQLFFERAMKHGLRGVAEWVFSATVPGDGRAGATAPALVPAGTPVLWLLRYLAGARKNAHLARALVRRVAEHEQAQEKEKEGKEQGPGQSLVPLHDRPEFVALAAAGGFGRHARALWERWAAARDAHVLLGNAGAMLRLVSLFAALARQAEARVPGGEGVRREEEARADVRGPNAHLDERRERRIALKRGGGVLEDGPRQDDKIMQRETIIARPDASGEDSPDLDDYAARAVDYLSFAERVVDEFRKAHEPLQGAAHMVLTSLARAHFILGDFAAGFELFRIMLVRREVPDMHDVNVALSAMAEANPRAAAKWMERMREKGFVPDSVSFGTVMHQAFAHDDPALARRVVAMARELGHERLTLRSLSAYIRGSLAEAAGQAPEAQRATLEEAMALLEGVRAERTVATADMGKRCVAAALAADAPALAFRFWRLLSHARADAGDGAQRGQRRAIAAGLRAHVRAGRVDAGVAGTMLAALGEPGCGWAGDVVVCTYSDGE
jgi:hypothetical protein